MLTRERRSLVPPPTPPDFGRTGRNGAGHIGLPVLAALPSLSAALSRRRALFGAVTVAGASAVIVVPTAGRTAPLSANDARLLAIAAELRAVFRDEAHVVSIAQHALHVATTMWGRVTSDRLIRARAGDLPKRGAERKL